MTDTVVCWYDQVIVTDIFGNYKGWNCLGPVLPNHLFAVVEHVECIHLLRKFCIVNHWAQLIVRVNFTLLHYIWASVN